MGRWFATIRTMLHRIDGKLLITGAHGQLGRALAMECRRRAIDFEGRDIDSLDIADEAAVTEWIEDAEPSDVINCAAFTAVDDCEADQETAFAVNGNAVGHLVAACDRRDARLVQISTDYVFAGDSDRPYREDDPVAPISTYGRSKLRGEELARTARRHLVVRTAWLYGHGGRNFVETIRSKIDGGAEKLRVVADQRGSPTFCGDLAAAIVELIGAGADGVVHAANTGETTWHGFAVEIVRLLGKDLEVLPVTTAEFPCAAPRPASSVLDTSRLSTILGRTMPTWEDALARYLESS
jgi:dTDP-4-dehydrorhamnose reductase